MVLYVYFFDFEPEYWDVMDGILREIEPFALIYLEAERLTKKKRDLAVIAITYYQTF